jgi:uncharacterized protein (TIGR00730 family)
VKLCFIGSGIEREATDVRDIEITSIARVLRARYDTLVFGGSRVGLMGAFGTAFSNCGGRVVSVLPPWLEREGLGFPADETVRCSDLAERKRLMFEDADGVLCYPGGIGTWDELFDLLARSAVDQTAASKSTCPSIYVYNWEKFYAPLLLQIETAVEIGLIHPRSVARVRPFESADSLAELIDAEGHVGEA